MTCSVTKGTTMKIGIATVPTDESIRPQVLAKLVEEREFDSLMVAEHSHIPSSRVSQFPGGGDLPREYYRVLDPFVALASAAAATSTLLVGTAILLLPQRDLFDVAKCVSTIDQVSDGRFILGLGRGWNLEEAADHGIDPSTRGRLLDEKLAALKELWAHDVAEFHGTHVDFAPTFCWPKPVQIPHPPVYIGGFGRATVSRARRHGAGWMPMAPPTPELVDAQMTLLDGGDDVPVSAIVPENVHPGVVEAYYEGGAERVSFALPTKPESDSVRSLDNLARLAAKFR
jgi:probable F420-dependent oxidoreductase